MDLQLQKEINGLKGDLNMTKIAVGSMQNDMKNQLLGDMGEDVNAVLNGERVVEVSAVEKGKYRIKSWFKRLFKLF